MMDPVIVFTTQLNNLNETNEYKETSEIPIKTKTGTCDLITCFLCCYLGSYLYQRNKDSDV